MIISLDRVVRSASDLRDELSGEIPPGMVPHVFASLDAVLDQAYRSARAAVPARSVALPVMRDLLFEQGRASIGVVGSLPMGIYFAYLRSVAAESQRTLAVILRVSGRNGEWRHYFSTRRKVVVLRWHLTRLALVGIRYRLRWSLPSDPAELEAHITKVFERRANAILNLI